MDRIHLPNELAMKHELAGLIKTAVKTVIRVALQDQKTHAEFVARGRFHFRQQFTKEIGIFFDGNRSQADDLANHVYGFLQDAWTRRYPDMTPGYVLDKHEEVSPPTEAEIDDAWELEIGSSDEALRLFYDGSARTRSGSDLGSRTNVDVKRRH
jgi:hypothetical protein